MTTWNTVPEVSSHTSTTGRIEGYDKSIEEGPFGPIGAATYDDQALCMSRRYKDAHAIQNRSVRTALRNSSTPHPVVVDLGCGTAADGIDILLQAGDAIYLGLDYSRHMLARAIDKFDRHGLQNRGIFLERDLRAVTADEMWAALGPMRLDRRVSSVISALALHHYELDMKGHVYKLAYDLLPAQGLLVLTDLYSNKIAGCAEDALRMEIRDVRRTLARIGSLEEHLHGDTTISERHYKADNRPQTLADEIALLARVGFRTIDLVYRSGQLGVIAAERGGL